MPVVMLGVFALTLFVSASLLFLVEPMIGKMMLPLLGGTPAVWNTCMLFFQFVLLAGYGYAHWTTKTLGPRKQALLHLGVLALPLLFFFVNGPLTVNPALIAGRETNPIFALLLVLTLTVGVPMFVICTSAPVLQRWFAATDHPAARDPYFLYGASNLGSMIALIGYPLWFEPSFTLLVQRHYWAYGYGGLVALAGLCAWMLWRSNPAPSEQVALGGAQTDGAAAFKPAPESVRTTAPAAIPELLDRETAPLTWARRLKWVILALVPSSLMLGATTYITTDIASMPFLWVLPLSLYLLTFIIVFAVLQPSTQNAFVAVGVWVLAGYLGFYLTPTYFGSQSTIRIIIQLGSIAACLWAFMIFGLKDKELIHHVMVMIMPLLVLLLIFLMLAEIKAGIWTKISLHLATLFVVAMVCHGELARDRPASKDLTEFFLLMSVGGVLGGLFNALVAPVAFNAIIEYQMMMMVACLLVPALGMSKDSLLARRADLALATVFVLVGGLLLFMFWLDFRQMAAADRVLPLAHWGNALLALVTMGVFGVLAAWQGWGTPPHESGEKPQNNWMDRALDVVLPLGLFILMLGLYWGLPSDGVYPRLAGFADLVGLTGKEGHSQFRNILTFGLPAVLCYTFVERSLRFGLGVGAILLAAGMSMAIREGAMYQQRSFFGVLKVESEQVRQSPGLWMEDRGEGAGFLPQDYQVTRLFHGTTLHGIQFKEEALRRLPTSYYHSTGPVGQVMRAYNHDPRRPVAVIGLGTGTVATYGLRGQTLDYFDIDHVVMDISFDTNRFFTYVEDAEARGVDVNLVLGDARLTFDPSGSRPRLKPLHKREGQPVPPRRFNENPLTGDFRYGLIFADAFSSDAIPVHLLTREAVEIYLRRLLPGGVICIHISNRHLDLQPVLANIVEAIRKEGIKDAKGNVIEEVPGLAGVHMNDNDENVPGKSLSQWIAIARDKKDLEKLRQVPLWQKDKGVLAAMGVALFPPLGTSMLAPTGMAFACQALAEKVALRAAQEEGRTGDLSFAPSDLEPLDTSHDMDARHDADEKEATRLEAVLKELRTKYDAVAKDRTAMLEKFGVVKKDFDEQEKSIHDLQKLVETGPASDRRTNQRNLEAARLVLKPLKVKFDAEQEKVRVATSRGAWLLDRLKGVSARLRRIAGYEATDGSHVDGRIDKLAARKLLNKRVGVWTDDYSNLWSVFIK